MKITAPVDFSFWKGFIFSLVSLYALPALFFSCLSKGLPAQMNLPRPGMSRFRKAYRHPLPQRLL